MYYKKVDTTSYKEMFEFLSEHPTYWTLNSWNKIFSIANNVKLYNIPDIDIGEALETLEDDNYFCINQAIHDWEEEHLGYKIGFNGRSGGYLVLYNSRNNQHCFYNENSSPALYVKEGYDYWKRCVQSEWGSLKAFRSTLIREVQLVQEFDQLCDDLVALTKQLIEERRDRIKRTKSYNATLRFQRYYYDTPEDLKLHMLDMKNRGFGVYEYSLEDLYAEFEMNEAISSEVVLDQEGDEEFVC